MADASRRRLRDYSRSIHCYNLKSMRGIKSVRVAIQLDARPQFVGGRVARPDEAAALRAWPVAPLPTVARAARTRSQPG